MLPSKYRLRKEKDFQQVHNKGCFFGHKFLAIKTVKNDLGTSRFGFLVGVKISKKAVQRNKVKRRLREIVRLRLDEMKPGLDVVVMVRPEIIDKNYQEIDEALSELLRKAHLLSKKIIN